MKNPAILRFSEMKTADQKVYFHYLKEAPFFNKKRKLKLFIESLFLKEKTRLSELHYIFCSDSYLLKINRDYLRHDFYTDIITFDLSHNKEVTGEVYISVDRLKENAKTFGVSYSDEAYRLLFHGALHLCGYKDKTKSDKAMMKKKENFYLKLMSVL